MNYRTTILTITILLLVASAGAYVYLANGRNTTPPVTKTYECNADGYVCPDGSIVGRTGLACEFSSCPGVLPATTTRPRASGILSGKVTLSPVCPLERSPPEPECMPRPYVTEVKAYTAEGKEAVGVRTSSGGTFMMDLFPGTYIIRAMSAGMYPRCPDRQVKISPNASTTIEISCDTGIR